MTDEQKKIISLNSEGLSVGDLAERLNLAPTTIYSFAARRGLIFKRSYRRLNLPEGKKQQGSEVRSKAPVPKSLLPDPEPERPKVDRPKAVYNNSGYLELLNRYA